MPRLSVIIPTYNRARVVGKAIRSVLAQGFADLECIVIDDGADETPEVVRAIRDPRVRYIKSGNPKGVSPARNVGIAQAKGELIAFLDSDDEWLPGKLARQLPLFDDPETGFVGGGWLEHRPGLTQPLVCIPSVGSGAGEAVLRRWVFLPSTVVVRGTLLDRVSAGTSGPFDERLPACEDWELWIRLSRVCRMVMLPEPLAVRTLGPDGLSGSPEAFEKGYRVILEKHGDLIRADAGRYAAFLFTLGHSFCEKGEMAKGRHELAHAMRVHPTLKCLAHIGASFLGRAGYNRCLALRNRMRTASRKVSA